MKILIKIVSKFHALICNNFREISRQKGSRSDRFIILNDSASRKIIINNYLIFPNFFKRFRYVWMSLRRPIYDCWQEFRSLRSLVTIDMWTEVPFQISFGRNRCSPFRGSIALEQVWRCPAFDIILIMSRENTDLLTSFSMHIILYRKRRWIWAGAMVNGKKMWRFSFVF